ncbi:PREDICTED: homeobox protein NANOG isoform X2 [Condylura cristata]|uniref:homeobox protein NANOG isoform X2 n=1 Tax=Condylura cristata TaxID=143302 RepID=UPI000642A055|nr:PREDICTED: homeobox protein NANOG isoform X2 [Condylura cristata]
MSVGPVCSQSLPCPETSTSRASSPMPEVYEAEEDYSSLPKSSAEMPHTENVSPLPSSMDLLIQDSPDSSTSPRVKLCSTSEENSTEKKEERIPVKKQKSRTVFSQTQLCVLNDRFQRQKYLSLQQMQELSNLLNLSYKQVKTWFQNQRMKCKRWQKSSWPKSGMTQGCLVNTPEDLPIWSNQPWSNPTWGSQSWSQPWCTQPWNNQPWNHQAWNSPLHSSGEDPFSPLLQLQQNFSLSDLEATLEICGENHNIIQPPSKYFSTQQIMDLFPTYSMNAQSEDV